MTAALQTETFSFRWGIPIDEIGHTPVPNWMLDYYAEAGVKQHEFLLILHLARYAYERPGTVCCPSVETLAAQLGVTPRALRQRLSEMEDRGLLQRQYRPGQTTVYDFTGFSERVREVKLRRQRAKNRKAAETSVGDLAQQGIGDRVQGGAEEKFRSTPEENCPPPRKKTSAEEKQRKEQKEKTTARSGRNTPREAAASSDDGAGAFFNSEEEEHETCYVTRETLSVERETMPDTQHTPCETHPSSLPQDLHEKAQALGFRGWKNWATLTQAYDEAPVRVRRWIEALAEGRVAAENPPGLLLVAVREGYPAPDPPPPEYGPPDPDCDICLGTGVPLIDEHWQYGEHCRCTWPEGYIPPSKPSAPQRKPPDPDCNICMGTGTPLVGGQWQRGQKCACTRV